MIIPIKTKKDINILKLKTIGYMMGCLAVIGLGVFFLSIIPIMQDLGGAFVSFITFMLAIFGVSFSGLLFVLFGINFLNISKKATSDQLLEIIELAKTHPNIAEFRDALIKTKTALTRENYHSIKDQIIKNRDSAIENDFYKQQNLIEVNNTTIHSFNLNKHLNTNEKK